MKLINCPGFHDVVNDFCTCGGGDPTSGCPACKVYHAIKDWEVGDEKPTPAPTGEVTMEETRAWQKVEGKGPWGDLEEAVAADVRANVARETEALRAESRSGSHG